MKTLRGATKRSRQTVRLAVTAAALGVAGMFTAAATFADPADSGQNIAIVQPEARG